MVTKTKSMFHRVIRLDRTLMNVMRKGSHDTKERQESETEKDIPDYVFIVLSEDGEYVSPVSTSNGSEVSNYDQSPTTKESVIEGNKMSTNEENKARRTFGKIFHKECDELIPRSSSPFSSDSLKKYACT